jgi:uncharacterized protein (TIGR02757 family)
MTKLPSDGELKAALDDVLFRCPRTARVARDPVGIVRRFRLPAEQEVVGLLASTFAFGNVTTILQKVEDALARVGTPLLGRIDALGLPGLITAFEGFRHRLFVGEDVARLLHGARRVQREAGSLGAAFASALAASEEGGGPDLQQALAAFVTRIRDAGGLVTSGKRRGPAHMLPDVLRGSGAKRLLLYLRWMVRADDGVDLGLWPVAASTLVIPVDTHIQKLAQNLGLTRRTDTSWKTASEITARLRRFDPADPVKYDFSLCHLGMVQQCPSRRDAKACEGCGVRPICRHWRSR